MTYNLIQQIQKLWKSEVDEIEGTLWLVGCVRTYWQKGEQIRSR